MAARIVKDFILIDAAVETGQDVGGIEELSESFEKIWCSEVIGESWMKMRCRRRKCRGDEYLSAAGMI